MPEGLKMPESVSPATRTGAGDISERELSRERSHLTTPPARYQRTYHKKQLFSTPVNKFTAKPKTPSSNLARLRSCLDEYQLTPARPAKIRPKAVSLEDLTPIKKTKTERKAVSHHVIKSPGLRGIAEEQAAARIGKFMLLASWRRRREEVRCVRKTLEFQVSCSERLRIQVCALKSLLDSDNAKVRLAMRELERLKQLLKEKDLEKAILEKEKFALEQDICAAEDRAAEINMSWRTCRGELEHARAAAAASEHELARARAALTDARARGDRASDTIATLEDELAGRAALLAAGEAQLLALRNHLNDLQRQLEHAREKLRFERKAREECSLERSALSSRLALSALEASALRAELEQLRAESARRERELRAAREQLAWWPRPLTRMLGVARSWLRSPMSLPEVVLWTLIPARHGC